MLLPLEIPRLTSTGFQPKVAFKRHSIRYVSRRRMLTVDLLIVKDVLASESYLVFWEVLASGRIEGWGEVGCVRAICMLVGWLVGYCLFVGW